MCAVAFLVVFGFASMAYGAVFEKVLAWVWSDMRWGPCRYEPVSKKLFGVVMLRDLQPGTEAELVKVCAHTCACICRVCPALVSSACPHALIPAEQNSEKQDVCIFDLTLLPLPLIVSSVLLLIPLLIPLLMQVEIPATAAPPKEEEEPPAPEPFEYVEE